MVCLPYSFLKKITLIHSRINGMSDAALPLKVLILEDRPADAELMLYQLRKEGYQPEWSRVDSEKEFLSCLKSSWDIILSDYSMPQFNAARALEIAQRQDDPPPFIVITGDIGEEAAVQMIKLGAADYLLKDRLTRLGAAVTNAIREYATAQKKQETEEKLRKSENKYRDLVENLNDIVYSIDSQRKISYIAPPISSLGGYSPEEILGHRFLEFVHPDDQQRIEKAFQRVLSGKQKPEEFRIISKTGQTRWVRTSSRMIQDGEDEFSIQGVMTDIDDEISTKQELEESEKRYRTIFENTCTTMLIVENDTTISMINENATALTGYSREEIEGKLSWTQLVAPEEKDRMVSYHQRRREEEQTKIPSSYTFTLITKSGKRIPALLSVQLIPETGQSVVSVIDISSQVDMQEQLKVSEKKYRGIFEGVKDAVFVEDDRGNILDVNQRACEMFGYTREEFLHKQVADIVVDEGLILGKDFLLSQGGSVEKIESENIRANGEIFPVELSAQLQTIDNRELVIIVLRDISSRKKTEEALQRQLKELSALHSIANSGTQETDEEEIIQHATQVIGDVLNPDFYGVMMLDPDHDRLVVSSSYQNIPPSCKRKSIPIGSGVTGEVAASGKSQNHADVSELKNFISVIPDIKSELCVPIKIHQKVLGVINIESRKDAAFDENDQRLLITLARQLATAIERARLFNTVGEQIKRLQTLRTIDRAISSSLDLNVTLNILLDQTTTQLNIDAATILLLEPFTQTLLLKAAKGFKSSSLAFSSVQIGSGLAGKVALDNQPVEVSDLTEAGDVFRDSPLLKREGFVFYYALPLTFKGKTQGVLELFHREIKDLDREWKGFAATLSGQAAIAIDNAEMYEDLQRVNLELTRSYDTTLKGWARALELRDHETEGHSQRVTSLTLRLARKICVPEDKLAHIRRGTLLHDIGKIAIPDSILLKPGKLNEEEWEVIKKHPIYARKMLEPINYLKEAMDIPLYHHERWDGSGYPEGLKGHEIPLAARIFAVVDVWDALINDRPYRKAWPHQQAKQYLITQAGKEFDPTVVDAFMEVLREIP